MALYGIGMPSNLLKRSKDCSWGTKVTRGYSNTHHQDDEDLRKSLFETESSTVICTNSHVTCGKVLVSKYRESAMSRRERSKYPIHWIRFFTNSKCLELCWDVSERTLSSAFLRHQNLQEFSNFTTCKTHKTATETSAIRTRPRRNFRSYLDRYNIL